jgi:hypothetical protein
MDRQSELEAAARVIIDANRYLTLGTADRDGRPWVSPVYYAAAGYSEFFWVSSPEARHSRNIAERPEVSLVIFDSRAVIGTGQAVYATAVAEEVGNGDLDRGIEIFSTTSVAHGAREWTAADVRPPAHLRLYRVLVSEHFVLDPDEGDQRVTVALS